jgi:crotonobetainyl-CoA:carnitine CoA-transferase CaiB-like acyl-CoA transferase
VPLLDTLTVAAITEGIAGGYCAKLLGDAGAHVTLVEPPDRNGGRSALRGWSASGARPEGEDGALFRFLHARHATASVAPDADVVVTDIRGLVPDARPGQVVVTITPFGVDGPWADRPATEFTLQAWCGSTGSRGTPDRPPVAAGGRIGLWVGGTYGAMAALAAARTVHGTTASEHVDVSLLECMTVTMVAYPFLFGSFTGWPEPRAPARSIEIPSIEPTADGWVGFCAITAQQFQDFLVLIERPDLIGDAEIASALGRAKRMDEVLPIIAEWTTKHTTADVIEQASLLRIPVVPIGNGENVTTFEQFDERGVFVRDGDGGVLHPRVPYRLHGAAVEHAASAQTRTASRGPLPLSGVRVVDFTAFWAGPAATHAMAALGADVVKVESIQRPDLMRYTTVKPPSVEQWWEWGPVFHGANAGKRSVTLDLNREEGRALVRRLIAGADVVIENFTPRVLDGFGLDWNAVHAINPRAVMVRMPAFGLDGPWRDRTGFAQNVEQVSGMAWVTGYADGPPRIPRGPCDPLGGMHAVFATMVALDRRDATGEGMLVESTLAEVALNVAAEQVVEHDAYGVLLERRGNDPLPGTRFQGVFACDGGRPIGGERDFNDAWVAIACETDAQLDALREVVGGDDVAGWCASRSPDDAAETLVAAGVPAGDVIRQERAAFNAQLVARGFFEELDHPVVGRHAFPSLPFVFRTSQPDGRRWLRSPAPTLGQHNDEVLRDDLGLSPDELAELRDDKLIGDRPLGV